MEYIIQIIVIVITAIACLLAGDYRISCFFLCALIVVLFLINILSCRRRERQLEEMITYLMKLQDGLQLPALTKCNEGQIGILQSEIYKLVVLLQERTDTASREKTYLAEMLSDISHQIKTPLTAITLMTDLLKNPDLPEDKQTEFVARIDKQVNKITWLIRNLLTLSQLEADMLRLKKEQVAVSKLFSEACQPLELLAEVKDVTILKDSGQGDEMVLVCDEAWTAEALSNIIKNCIEYTSEGGTVQITALQHNFATDITIRDNGRGIAKEEIPHIFERFYKGKQGSKDSVGIGLAMARQIILRQNGVISVESTQGEGTIFHIKMYSNITI